MRKAIIAVVLTALAIAGMTAATAFGWWCRQEWMVRHGL